MDDIRPPKPAGTNKSAPSPKLPPALLDEPQPDSNDPAPIINPETDITSHSVGSLAAEPKKQPKKGKWWQLGIPRLRHADLSKKQWALLGLAGVVLLILTTVSAMALYKHFTKLPPQAKQPAAVKAAPKPKLVPSRLTGIETSQDLNNRPITGVMIENSPDARPQSGLLDAGVVYEAIAEGGITRFLALFLEAQPDRIGPVRSARPYYLDFILPFQGSLAHVGGSPDALSQIKSLNVRDLDEFANSGAYQRDAKRYAPHNVYTSSAQLDGLEKSKGFDKSDFTGFPRKKDAPSKTPNPTSIDLEISSFYYHAHYDYDPGSNSYKRKEGGVPHVDERTQKQLSPKVVIALVMSYSLASDGKHSVYETTGSGTAYVFQDGIVTQGKWNKAGRSDQITFTDAQGKAIKLNAGQTWISLVDATSDVTYK